MDGLVGVVLKRRVGQIGEDVRLVDQGTLKRVGHAGVEHAARQGRVGDAVDHSPRGPKRSGRVNGTDLQSGLAESLTSKLNRC